MQKKLVIGFPKGSSINPERSKLLKLLKSARITTENLGEDAPPVITNIGWAEAFLGRPQDLPGSATSGFVDIYFCGDDWATEHYLRGTNESEKLLDLDIWDVDIVSVEKKKIEDKRLIRIASEYDHLARNYASERFGIQEEDIPIKEIGEELPSKGIVVLKSYGATEAKLYYDIADMIVELKQLGKTLENYDLEIADVVMESGCSLYANKRAMQDPWKREKAQRIKMMLEGAMKAQGKDLLTLNVGEEDLEEVLSYIRKKKLFGDQETVIPLNKKLYEVTFEVPTNNPELPLVDIIADLKELGASSIDGIPLSYSIK